MTGRTVLAVDIPQIRYSLASMEDKVSLFEQGLLWGAHDVIISKSWNEVCSLAQRVHGGIGMLAADFNELVRYGQGNNHWRRREIFKEIVSTATSGSDIAFLAEVLSV